MARRSGVSGALVRIWDATRARSVALLIVSLLAGPGVGQASVVAAGAAAPVGAATEDSQDGRWSVASLPEPRSGMQTVTAGDVALFFDGRSLGPPSRVVDVYDHATRQWTTATLSVGRTGPSTAAVGTKILVVGGWDSTGSPSRVVDLYDTATGQWSVSRLPQPWGGGEVVVVGQKVLLVGPETVDVVDAQTGQASTATLVQPRTRITVAVAGTRVLLAGGTVDDAPSTMVDVYDSATESWTTATLPRPRSDMHVSAVGQRVLFAGGEVDKQPTDVVDVYDVAAGTWTTAKLSVARRDFAQAVVGNVVLFAGSATSRTPNDPPLDVVDLYDAATDTWSTARLSESRRVIAAVAGHRAVFVTASACYEDGCTRTVDVYDGHTGAWSTTELRASQLFAPGLLDDGIRVGGIVVGVGNQVLFAGGSKIARYGAGQQYSARFSTRGVQIYDTESGQWSDAELSNAAYGPATSVSGTLVALAGRNSGRQQLGMSTPPAAETIFDTVNLYSSATGEWITGTLSEPRRDVGLAVLGNTAIFAGGTIRNANEDRLTRVELYDGATGEWSTTTFPGELPEAGRLSTLSVGTRALFYDRYGVGAVTIFDAVTRQWSTHEISPTRVNVAVAVVGDQVLFAGGGGNTDDDASSIVDVYDSRTGSWSSASLSQAREEPGIVVVGTRAIVAGGWVNGRPQLDSDIVDIYDAASGAWSTSALPTVRGAPKVATAVGTRALFIGKGKVDVYDVTTGGWTTVDGAPPRIDMAIRPEVLTVGTSVLLVDEPEVAVYETTTNQWTTFSLTGRPINVNVAVVGPEVIVVNGYGDSSSPLSPLDIYDARTGTWRTVRVWPRRQWTAVTVVGSRAIFAGGSVVDGGPTRAGPTDQVDIYDAQTGAWTTERLSVPRSGISAASVGSTALFVGGEGGGRGRSAISDRVDVLYLGADQGG